MFDAGDDFKREAAFLTYRDERKTEKTRPSFSKNETAFESGVGVCYVDGNGTEYDKARLKETAFSDEGTRALFEELQGETPEKTAERSPRFRKCGRCGKYAFGSGKSLFGIPNEFACGRCVPMRTGGKIPLWKDPYCDDRRFFRGREAKFETGITTLIGCNGIGKTTLLRNVAEKLKERGTPYLMFDNAGDEGGASAPSRFLSLALTGRRPEGFEDAENPLAFAADVWSSSEGERIGISFAGFMSRLAGEIRRKAGYGEFWILADALDSGLSLDVADVVKKALSRLVESSPENVRVYVILSSNSYEMSCGTACFSVEKMRYVPIKSYSAFRKAVYSSLACKEKRDEVLDAKAEIAARPYEFRFAEPPAEGVAKGSLFEVARLELGDYEMKAEMKGSRSDAVRFRLTKGVGTERKELSCRGAEPLSFWEINRKDAENRMLSYLRRRIFLDERKERRENGL